MNLLTFGTVEKIFSQILQIQTSHDSLVALHLLKARFIFSVCFSQNDCFFMHQCLNKNQHRACMRMMWRFDAMCNREADRHFFSLSDLSRESVSNWRSWRWSVEFLIIDEMKFLREKWELTRMIGLNCYQYIVDKIWSLRDTKTWSNTYEQALSRENDNRKIS